MAKKIAFLHPHLVIGGAETVLIDYLNIIAQDPNFDVTLFIFNSSVKYNIDKIDKKIKIDFLLNSIESEFYHYCYQKKSSLSFESAQYYEFWYSNILTERTERLIQKINHANYDVVIDFLNVFKHHIPRSYFDKITPPVIYWVHSNLFGSWLEHKEQYQAILHKYHTIVYICEDMKNLGNRCLEAILGIRDKPSKVIFNPVSQQKVLGMLDQPVSSSDVQLLNHDFILQVGRLEEYSKNHLQMIDIFYQLKQKGIKEKLYIIGEGDGRKALEQKIKSLGLEQDCLLLGNRANPFPFMKAAKVFIHTAKFEGLPTVLIESMICGTPVVAFNCSTGPREILADGKYGELIPQDNEALFIEKAYRLLNDEALRQHYISLLPEAVERFSPERIEKQFVTLIENVTKKS